MPGYIIHMVEAKMICDILLRDSQSADQIGEQWQEGFLFGSLLPDAGDEGKRTACIDAIYPYESEEDSDHEFQGYDFQRGKGAFL